MFVLGRIYDPESFDNEPAVVTVYADGRKIADEIVRKYDVPRRMTLDISGVDELEFAIVKGEDDIGFAEVSLWKEGETPVETGNPVTAPAQETFLVKDLEPYAQYNHFCVSPEADADVPEDINPRLKSLPDVCRLVSSIPPYAVGGQIEHQVYDGKSDHITFSMGGTRFSEGFILYEKADFWNDNIVSYAVFDLGREFDYVSFTAGYVGKSWAMTNDVIRVYAEAYPRGAYESDLSEQAFHPAYRQMQEAPV